MSYTYNPPSKLPLPPEADAETLQALAKHHGAAAVTELDEAVDVLARAIRTQHKAMVDAETIRARLPIVQDATARRSTYVARATTLRRLLKLKPTEAAAIPPVKDFIGVLSRSTTGQDLRRQLATAAAGLRSEIDQVDAAQLDLEAAAGDPVRYEAAGNRESWRTIQNRELVRLMTGTRALLVAITHNQELAARPLQAHEFETEARRAVGIVSSLPADSPQEAEFPQDGWIRRYSSTTSRKKALAGRLAALDYDRGQTTRVVTERVHTAVDAAGGVDLIVDALKAAEVLTADFPAKLAPFTNTVNNLEAELASITSDFDRLALAVGDCFHGPAADSLRNKQAEARRRLDAARSQLRDHHDQLAAEVLDQAMHGDEAARERIEVLTTSCADAFPAGFGSAIAAAKFENAAILEVAAILTP